MQIRVRAKLFYFFFLLMNSIFIEATFLFARLNAMMINVL